MRDVHDEFSRVPANGLFGFRLLSTDDGTAEVALQPDGSHTQENCVVHGGLIAALADTTAVYALLADLPADRTVTGVEFKINFLRPAQPAGGMLLARARRGRRIAVCEVEVIQEQSVVAKGSFTYLVGAAQIAPNRPTPSEKGSPRE